MTKLHPSKRTESKSVLARLREFCLAQFLGIRLSLMWRGSVIILRSQHHFKSPSFMIAPLRGAAALRPRRPGHGPCFHLAESAGINENNRLNKLTRI